MATYLYPTAREIRELGAVLMAQAVLNDPLLTRILPIKNVNAPMLQWNIADDDYGLQQLRGLDGAPQHVARLGKTGYVSEPGYFGEFETIGERELTLRGGSVIGESTIDLQDLVATALRQLVSREVTRIRQIGWTLLTTGTFSVSGKGSTLTYTDTFALNTSTGTSWGTPTTATPLADLRAVQLGGAQYGVNFGAASVAVMNRTTANRMFQNSNTADLGGRKGPYGASVNDLASVNKIAMGEDLPSVVVVDDGYRNDSSTFVRFIGDGIVVVMGMRNDGDAIGEYRMTRNANNADYAPGSYEYIKDYIRGINAPKETPPKIEIHRGHSGGPVILRPKAITILTVT